MVIYPISRPDADGRALINWIAEVTVDSSGGWTGERWFEAAEISDFVHHFDAFRYPWLDVPAFLSASEAAWMNPMIDRDPVPTWVEGRVALMGDAAHAMYPTGSNGASQAIIDARTIGAMMLAHGVGPEALSAYDAALCGPVSELVLRNRNAGPFGLLDIVDARCGGRLRRYRRRDPARRTRGLHRRLQGRRRLRHRPAERRAADHPARARGWCTLRAGIRRKTRQRWRDRPKFARPGRPP
jgi:2-polyprenyl-6-methoxyphenol hydroxylase-like FAD-dependent oxidoreductase